VTKLSRGATQSNAPRGVAYQIPRNALALLMIAQAVVVAPYLFELSPWIIAVGLFCGYWRTGVFQGRWDYPRRWIKVVLVLSSIGGVAVSGVEPFSLEAAASLLILAFALKLIEMKSRRDAYLVIFLGYFIVATLFLFQQTITVAAYQLGALVVVTAAMVALNQQATRVRPLESLRVALVLVVQALPLTVVLFLFFPRVAPLWSVPLPSASSTGISDRMTPGDVAQLARSDELAFRVVFDGAVPPNRELYWRGLVYSRFQDGTWSVGGLLPEWRDGERPLEPDAGVRVDYEVLLEPTQSDWLFALETPLARTSGVELSRDYRLVAPDPVHAVYRYRASSFPALLMDAAGPLEDRLRVRETWLPDADNPRLRSYASDVWQRSDGEDDFVREVLTRIRQEPYFYTLSPPALPATDSIDRFWFDTRRGFCTHYAGALVFMLRSVGIPARLVGGYQGGEINPVTGHLIVRQYDAHAWVEYWRPGQGWRRVDPTAAVAPARIEQGLSAALSEEDRASLSALTGARLSGTGLLRNLLYWTDSLEHRWNLWVIGYDTHLQAGVLTRLLGEITPARVLAAVLVGGGLSVALVVLSLFWQRRPVRRHPVERLFARFCQGVAGAGWQRAPAEPPATFLRRVAAGGGIGSAQADRVIADLDRLLYNSAVRITPRELRQLRSQLRRLQFRLMLGAVR
jgi:protein-glutamine gamma-glutamyltransferase